jgi:hypothetical protein
MLIGMLVSVTDYAFKTGSQDMNCVPRTRRFLEPFSWLVSHICRSHDLKLFPTASHDHWIACPINYDDNIKKLNRPASSPRKPRLGREKVQARSGSTTICCIDALRGVARVSASCSSLLDSFQQRQFRCREITSGHSTQGRRGQKHLVL